MELDTNKALELIYPSSVELRNKIVEGDTKMMVDNFSWFLTMSMNLQEIIMRYKQNRLDPVHVLNISGCGFHVLGYLWHVDEKIDLVKIKERYSG
jgi:hypothetical protein